MSVRAALAAGRRGGVDLVEIAPMAQPPVCRIVDFGKFKYQEQKRQHEQKLKQKQVQVKEVKLRPGTDENDYQIKLRNMTRFLRGRRQGQGHPALPWTRNGPSGDRHATDRAYQDPICRTFATVEQMPKMEGRQMVMVLTPNKKK
jgi:translation initiation factor IF-3